MSESTPYDRLPYDSNPFAQTHPGHLCALARLHGVNAPEPRRARVLEVGCASGGNLVPMAEQLPYASLVGIDLSARQIGMAKNAARAAGLKNLTFTHADVVEYQTRDEQYDYIIAHGVFSWMPEVARDALMQLCSQCLSPTGVAYISYNTYPGWHLRGAVRDMMMYHTRDFESDVQKVQQARALLSFLQKNAATGADAYAMLLESEASALANVSDSYIRHEHLSGDNEPMYFHEFVSQAQSHQLKFLAEAELASHSVQNLKPDAVEAINALSEDFIRREQFLDFLRNRPFRQSLLVHSEVPTATAPLPAFLDSLAISAKLTREDLADAANSASFTSIHGTSLTTANRALITVLTELSERYPDRLNAQALIHAVSDDAHRQGLSNDLTYCVQMGLVAAHAIDAPCAVTLDERPVASRVARAQVAQQQSAVASLNHHLVELDPLCQQVLARLDGSLTEAELVDELIDLAVAGGLRVALEGRPVVEPSEIRTFLTAEVHRALTYLMQNAVLLAPGYIVEGVLSPNP